MSRVLLPPRAAPCEGCLIGGSSSPGEVAVIASPLLCAQRGRRTVSTLGLSTHGLSVSEGSLGGDAVT
jgi:hypothetical protein